MRPEDIQSTRAGEASRQSTGYWAYLPKPLAPELAYSPLLIRLLDEARGALGELAGLGRTLTNPWILVHPAIRREAVLSSRIEGTHSTLGDLYRYEAEPQDAAQYADVREVHNYVVALEYGLARLATLPISLRLMRELHERLMRGVRGDHALPGEFRTTQNWIGPPGATLAEATYVPPPVAQMNEALDALERHVHADSDMPPLIRLALIHVQFEMIHPFVDGNGRVGRLLIVLLLVHWGLLPQPLLYLSAFFERHRNDYYRGLLDVSEKGRWEEWVEFFLRGVREQARDALESARAIIDLREKYRILMAGGRASRIKLDVVEDLFVNPWVSAPMVRDRMKVTFRTAQKAIDELVKLGVLHEMTGQRRYRMWQAYDIVQIHSRETRDTTGVK